MQGSSLACPCQTCMRKIQIGINFENRIVFLNGAIPLLLALERCGVSLQYSDFLESNALIDLQQAIGRLPRIGLQGLCGPECGSGRRKIAVGQSFKPFCHSLVE